MLSLRSKAAHLVSGFTSVILNPISDQSSASPPRDGEGMVDTESPDRECDGRIPDGPDTSSFTAFLVSLLSSSESDGHFNELNGKKDEIDDVASTSATEGNGGRTSLLAWGKQSAGKALQNASRMSGYRYSKSEKKADGSILADANPTEQQMIPLKVKKETILKIELPGISEPSMLLSESLRSTLYFSLPVQVKGKNWVLLYSTWQHGISLSTLYRRSMLCPGYSLLVVGDQKGAVFGGLVEAPLLPTTMKKYQGTNSTFVFTTLSSAPVIFRPTGANRYFTLCSTDYLALGGGGHFALYLTEDLLTGSSFASETFGNSCLAHTENFSVKEVELWGFVYASKYDETLKLCRTEAPGILRW